MARPGSGDAASLARDLKAGRTRPVYFLHGEEFYLKEEAARRIREAVLGKAGAGELSWSQTVLEGGTASLAEVLDAARTLPMLSPRRLVLVKDAERIREADAAPLKQYLMDPSPTTCLVFLAGTGKLDLRKAVFRALKEGASAVEFPILRGRSVERWIREWVREREAEIDPEGPVLLEAHLGSELFRIDQALAQALEFLSPSRRITLEALGEILGTAAAGSVFDLAEKVGAGDQAEAVSLLRKILSEERGLSVSERKRNQVRRGDERKEWVLLLSLIARQIRILILGKALVKRGHRGNDLAQALGIPPNQSWLLEKNQKLIARFPDRAGAPAMRRILEADRAIKIRPEREGPAILERLVLDLTSLVRRNGGRERVPA